MKKVTRHFYFHIQPREKWCKDIIAENKGRVQHVVQLCNYYSKLTPATTLSPDAC